MGALADLSRAMYKSSSQFVAGESSANNTLVACLISSLFASVLVEQSFHVTKKRVLSNGSVTNYFSGVSGNRFING